MSILVLAEHDNTTLNPSTLHAVSAASEIGGDITVLVAGVDQRRWLMRPYRLTASARFFTLMRLSIPTASPRISFR